MKRLLLLLCLLLNSCAFGSAKGTLCDGASADIWAWGFLQKPELVITCTKGGGVNFNNENELSQLSALLAALAQLAAKVQPGLP